MPGLPRDTEWYIITGTFTAVTTVISSRMESVLIGAVSAPALNAAPENNPEISKIKTATNADSHFENRLSIR